MHRHDSEARSDATRGGGCLEAAVRVGLVGCMWVLFRILEIPDAVAIITIVAVFGPNVMRAALDTLSSSLTKDR
jgi:hypothetical protein